MFSEKIPKEEGSQFECTDFQPDLKIPAMGPMLND